MCVGAGRKPRLLVFSCTGSFFTLSALPQAVLPTLEVGGKTLVQSNAISRFVAREHGMYGKNNVESTQIDAIIETTADLNVAFRTARQKADADTQAEVTKKLYEEEGPRYLGYIEKLIEAAGKDGYAVSNSLSLADCYIHATVDTLGLKATLEKFPKVAACVKRVEENANIAKWLKERPKTDY